MSRTLSPSTQAPHGVARVTAVWGVARSSFYAARQRQSHPREPQKRGPKVLSDSELLAEIHRLLAAPVFPGEGYRKIWARPRLAGVRASKERVLRLMHENQLLSPARGAAPIRASPHEGTIVAELPNQMWGTDATATFTEQEGVVTIFAAIDHCSADCVGIHAVKKASRFEALEPIRQGMKEYFGGFSSGIAAGLWVRRFRDLESFALPLRSSASVTTSTGSFIASGIAHPLKPGANLRLNYQARHDSTNQLTPTDLSSLPGPKQSLEQTDLACRSQILVLTTDGSEQ